MKKILICGENSYVGESVRKYLEQWPKKYSVEEISVRGKEWKKFDFSKFKGNSSTVLQFEISS